ncbi:MAG: NUDIX hydrolase [Euryarchaeota archaeon]|nr:NUDIX hydrolase [Euryarchaeota archaeon]|tara:strand:- start:2721 stop:3254 length:534 start_codon:yes stop_codon:yes gene_type:complete
MDEKSEIFDIVNDSDKVIGSASRSEVHNRGLKHRSVHLLIFNKQGSVLLQKRSIEKDTFPGTWDSSVSGHVDSGETYDEAVIRESWEELGVKFDEVPEKIFKVDSCKETDNEFSWIFRHFSEGPFSPNLDEISEIKWFTMQSLDDSNLEDSAVFSPAFSLIWSKLMNNPEGDSNTQI